MAASCVVMRLGGAVFGNGLLQTVCFLSSYRALRRCLELMALILGSFLSRPPFPGESLILALLHPEVSVLKTRPRPNPGHLHWPDCPALRGGFGFLKCTSFSNRWS